MPRQVEIRCRIPKSQRGKKYLPMGLPRNISCKKVRKLIRCVKKIRARPKKDQPRNVWAVCRASILR